MEKPLPIGVSSQMHNFLLDAKESGAYQSLDPRSVTLIDTYYFNDVSTSELLSTAGVNSRQGVNHLIKSGIETLWANTPEHIRTPFAKEDIVKLKDRASMVKLKNSKPRSIETRRKISEKNKGHRHSPETRAKMTDAHRGKVLTSETRRKISEARIGKPSPMKDRSHSPETRTKMSKSQQERRLKEREAANAEIEYVIFDPKASEGLH